MGRDTRVNGSDMLGRLVPAERNIEYVQSALAQFLLRFRRDNYVPDAIMIYGAYGDNAAIPETGACRLWERVRVGAGLSDASFFCPDACSANANTTAAMNSPSVAHAAA